MRPFLQFTTWAILGSTPTPVDLFLACTIMVVKPVPPHVPQVLSGHRPSMPVPLHPLHGVRICLRTLPQVVFSDLNFTHFAFREGRWYLYFWAALARRDARTSVNSSSSELKANDPETRGTACANSTFCLCNTSCFKCEPSACAFLKHNLHASHLNGVEQGPSFGRTSNT